MTAGRGRARGGRKLEAPQRAQTGRIHSCKTTAILDPKLHPQFRGAAGIWGPGPKAFIWGFGKSSGLSLQTHWEIMA
ncbi:hypothetical protein NQZ68_026717 [Dissostichus eleginoides]|nr:hypothetical protein NQZ68_026717 [Dissostichus eleginoides]